MKLIEFTGVAAGEACTVVLRRSTHQMVDETERSLRDAPSVLSHARTMVVPFELAPASVTVPPETDGSNRIAGLG